MFKNLWLYEHRGLAQVIQVFEKHGTVSVVLDSGIYAFGRIRGARLDFWEFDAYGMCWRRAKAILRSYKKKKKTFGLSGVEGELKPGLFIYFAA